MSLIAFTVRRFPFLGCLLLAVFLTPVLAQDLYDARGTAPARDRNAVTDVADDEQGHANVFKTSNMYLVDGADGGTIYAYNYALRQIVYSFPTPEAADGVNLDALAYASDRGTLFYTNSAGTGLVYEIDAQTGAVLRSFDGWTASGGRPIVGMGYGDAPVFGGRGL